MGRRCGPFPIDRASVLGFPHFLSHGHVYRFSTDPDSEPWASKRPSFLPEGKRRAFSHVQQPASICLSFNLLFPCWLVEGIHHYWKYYYFFRGLQQTQASQPLTLSMSDLSATSSGRPSKSHFASAWATFFVATESFDLFGQLVQEVRSDKTPWAGNPILAMSTSVCARATIPRSEEFPQDALLPTQRGSRP